ncbi:L,D-transpeptidase catalytic domain [Pseudoxanthomonas sp. CF385]|uniref:L,D-transpeptidase family protein n=1 Tax=Pseudoxanthomonas sp. CF385 TaxID=1881042 RepID=UPI00088420F0|nr:L,D-transpeptidase family protein [Pseudoxanthomonas sp. CF385]SDQ56798.1 L,D-transpeptidase catalytic domain [Pseudoxanthomonas sp. CF385]
MKTRFVRWFTALLVASGLAPAQAHEAGRPAPALLPVAQQADAIRVYKAQRRLDLLRAGRVIATYRVVLGGEPVGHKRQQGDQRTPEGDYRITYRNDRSRFHLSLRISYPDDADRHQAVARGVDPGGDIMIHGATPPGSRTDWTEGCIAVTDAEMDAIWQRVPVGTPIRIDP